MGVEAQPSETQGLATTTGINSVQEKFNFWLIMESLCVSPMDLSWDVQDTSREADGAHPGLPVQSCARGPAPLQSQERGSSSCSSFLSPLTYFLFVWHCLG